MATTYPLSVARTLALYAQGLSNRDQDDSLISTTDFQRMIEQLGCVQIDTLHMVRRSHYLVLWSRLGSYEPADLDAPGVAHDLDQTGLAFQSGLSDNGRVEAELDDNLIQAYLRLPESTGGF